MAGQILDKMRSALVKGAMIHGQWPQEVTIDERFDPTSRTLEVCVMVETRKQPFLASYIGVLEEEMAAAHQQMRLPWWKLLWRKWRGQLETRMPWERKAACANQLKLLQESIPPA